jgi:amidase
VLLKGDRLPRRGILCDSRWLVKTKQFALLARVVGSVGVAPLDCAELDHFHVLSPRPAGGWKHWNWAFAPGFGAINETDYTPMLHAPLPEKVGFYPIDHAATTAGFKALDSDFPVKIPVHPFLGCIGVAPANGEARTSVVPAEFGGNMDSPEASVGNSVHFPVNLNGWAVPYRRWARCHGRRRDCGHGHGSSV